MKVKLSLLLITLGVILMPAMAQNDNQNNDPAADQLQMMSAQQLEREDQALRDQAFAELPSTLFPLDSDQIKTLRREFNTTQRANSFTQDVPSRPTSSSLAVDLSPGATPPIIRLGQGFVTSLIFLDSTGQPWPIKGYDVGNPTAFNIIQPTAGGSEKGGNTLLIQSSTMYKQANLAVILQGLNTPIMITLLPGQQAIDYRVDMQVPRSGPNATIGANQSLPGTINSVMMDIVNHVIPKECKKVIVKGVEAEAWVYGTKLYLRTPLTLISPGWTSKLSGADGTIFVYEISDPISKIILLDSGEMKHATLEGI